MGSALAATAAPAVLMGSGGKSTPPAAGSQSWLYDNSNVARNSLPPLYQSKVPLDATKMPTELGQLLFPSSYNQVANPTSAALPKFFTPNQPAPDIYKSYMQYASRLLNPDLYRR